jgi:hypothetical protein
LLTSTKLWRKLTKRRRPPQTASLANVEISSHKQRGNYRSPYDVVTLKDCTATVSGEEQRLAVEKNYPMFSKPMTHEEFLTDLKG